MHAVVKKAILDTDFLFKTLLARNYKQEPLAEMVINFKDYEFYCHNKIIEELTYHGFEPNPVPWLRDKIAEGSIKCYSDEDILDELEDEYGINAVKYYFDMLKMSCDSFDPEFFNKFYISLVKLSDDADKQAFLNTLKICDRNILNGSSMGEKKLFVLAQALELKYPGQVVVFCSDDSRARQNVTYIDGSIRCLSMLATFQKLRNEGFNKDEVKQYYDSLCRFYSLHGQKTMKVWKNRTSERVNVDFEQLFDEIYSDMFEIKRTGDLRYK